MIPFSPRYLTILLLLSSLAGTVKSQPPAYNAVAAVKILKEDVDAISKQLEIRMIEWRHHLHEFPELSNREFKTADFITTHLQSLGLEIRTHVAHTGIVAVFYFHPIQAAL